MKRIMIAGTNSGCGKTTVVCAVLQALINRGINAASFKCGPDYIDPIFHSRIIGIASHNLDGVFCSRDTLNYLLSDCKEDLGVIEGVMGYYDGVNGKYSCCQTAVDTDTPAVLVIDCKGMSTSIGAVMKGYLTFKQPNNIIGFIFNRLPASLTDTAKQLCHDMNTEYFGRLPYRKDLVIESRHLGLSSDADVSALKNKLQALSELAQSYILIDKLIEYSNSTHVEYEPPCIERIAKRPVRIAVSDDEAFCFCYRDNMALLQKMGCETVRFSPLKDAHLPHSIDGLILTGGYPELYCERLSENKNLLGEIRSRIESGLPTIAECGGFMYLHERIETNSGEFFPMVGVIKGICYKTDRLQRFGYMELTAKNDTLLCKAGETIKAHEFHYWESTNAGNSFDATKLSSGMQYECIHSNKTLYAGYPHLYLLGNIEAAKRYVRKCYEYGETWKE